jgi:microcystin-dependent protein
MSDPYLGQIAMIAFNFAPKDWAYCDGQILPISQNMALASLLGTTFGGNGSTTYGLPDMRGRTPMHSGQGITLGMMYGFEDVALTETTMGTHTHAFNATTSEGTIHAANPSGAMTLSTANTAGGSTAANIYANASSLVATNPTAVSSSGGGLPHENCQPSTVVGFVIALAGLYPSRN